MEFKPLTTPRKWTKQEEKTVYKLYKQGHTTTEIAQKTRRSEPSIRNKIRRLKKKTGRGEYDKGHTITKHLINQRFLKKINPHTILDLYNAGNKQYQKYQTTTNDKDARFNTDYHEDAYRLITTLYPQEYDIIDLDPYGGCAPLIPYATRMAQKGLIITLGELGHKKFKRLDYVKKHYRITSMDDFTAEHINQRIITKAYKMNKKLTPFYYRDWGHIARIWYKVSPLN